MTQVGPKKEYTFGLFDEPKLERIFRKAAFCRALSRKIKVKEVRGWLADFEEVDIPAPIETRRETATIYAENYRRFKTLSSSGAKLQLRVFLRSILEGQFRDVSKIREVFQGVDRYNAKILNRLTIGQYATAGAGLAAGLGLVALGTGGALALVAAGVSGATEVTSFGLVVGSAGKLTGATVLTNVLVSEARGWSDCESWDGIAIAGGSQGGTELFRGAASAGVDRVADTIFEKWYQAQMAMFEKSPTFWGKVECLFKAHGIQAGRVGSKSVLPVAFASIDVWNEFKQFRRSTESPHQRSQRISGST